MRLALLASFAFLALGTFAQLATRPKPRIPTPPPPRKMEQSVSIDLPFKANVLPKETDYSEHYEFTYDTRGRITKSELFLVSDATPTMKVSQGGVRYTYTTPLINIPSPFTFNELTSKVYFDEEGRITNGDSSVYTFGNGKLLKMENFILIDNGFSDYYAETYEYDSQDRVSAIKLSFQDRETFREYDIIFNYQTNTIEFDDGWNILRVKNYSFINGVFFPLNGIDEAFDYYESYKLDNNGNEIEQIAGLDRSNGMLVYFGTSETCTYTCFPIESGGQICSDTVCESTYYKNTEQSFQNGLLTINEISDDKINYELESKRYFEFFDFYTGKNSELIYEQATDWTSGTLINYVYENSSISKAEYFEIENEGFDLSKPSFPQKTLVFADFRRVTNLNNKYQAVASFHPNPVSGIANTPTGNYVLSDIYGKQLSEDYSNGKIDFSTLDAGTYLLKFEQHQVIRFVKN